MDKDRYVIKLIEDNWFGLKDKTLYIKKNGKAYSGYYIDQFALRITKFTNFYFTQFDIFDNNLKYWNLKDILELTNDEYRITNNYDDKIENILSASKNINSALGYINITPTINLECLTDKKGITYTVDELYMDSLHNILWKQEK